MSGEPPNPVRGVLSAIVGWAGAGVSMANVEHWIGVVSGTLGSIVCILTIISWFKKRR